jgi:hypothetical protein
MTGVLTRRYRDAQAARDQLKRTLDLASKIAGELVQLRTERDAVERQVVRDLIGKPNPLGKADAVHSYTSAKTAACEDPRVADVEAALGQKSLEWGNVQRSIAGAKADWQLALTALTLGTELSEEEEGPEPQALEAVDGLELTEELYGSGRSHA